MIFMLFVGVSAKIIISLNHWIGNQKKQHDFYIGVFCFIELMFITKKGVKQSNSLALQDAF
jgi:hypothetical protein